MPLNAGSDSRRGSSASNSKEGKGKAGKEIDERFAFLRAEAVVYRIKAISCSLCSLRANLDLLDLLIGVVVSIAASLMNPACAASCVQRSLAKKDFATAVHGQLLTSPTFGAVAGAWIFFDLQRSTWRLMLSSLAA